MPLRLQGGLQPGREGFRRPQPQPGRQAVAQCQDGLGGRGSAGGHEDDKCERGEKFQHDGHLSAMVVRFKHPVLDLRRKGSHV